ncbi:tyrosine-type recombinase/integrase [Mesoterricola silvestris]|uniref:Integrase n=1 Tax=Mesoterricola silvestris TaxID=2927979 RepID=A0AA48GHV0_9BACT|nr:tyrosine-type recombinase/integrase [Mesoterricola silvestris]BDU71517.1 integrase [Mesoterricola silvestris]
MTGAIGFISCLGPILAQYVELKQSVGLNFDAAGRVLLHLDRFLSEKANGPEDFDANRFGAWCRTFEHVGTGTRRARMRIIYLFCLYRRRTEPGCFLPDPALFPPYSRHPRPYIFDEHEIPRLLDATQELKPHPMSPLRREVYRLALVLLYTSGLRRGELLRLTLGDYLPTEQTLMIRESKFYKSRMIPLSVDGSRELDAYLTARRNRHLPMDAASPLLVQGRRDGYSGGGIYDGLRGLFKAAGIHTETGGTPRVHDLRHTFAVHALLRWYREGADLGAKLPFLSAYMGHVSPVSTEYYLPFVASLAGAASEKFAEHCKPLLESFEGLGGSL